MKFKFITANDPEYTNDLMIRWEVLFKPLGKPPGSQVGPEEEKSLHFIALDKKKVVGCLAFYPETERSGRIYQMAVSEDYQGKGFGRQMMVTLEHELVKKGFHEIAIHTPLEKVGFYVKLGYHAIGNLMEKVGVPYQFMMKIL